MQVQNDLGADIIMAFDECPDPNKPREYQQLAVERTLRWAEQCMDAHARPDDQSLFGIVQGGTDRALRSMCAEKLIAMDFPGYAIGGLAVGEGFEAMQSGAGLHGAAAADRQAAISDGRGLSARHRGGGRGGGGHVRLRHAHAQRPKRLRVHRRRRDPAAEQPVYRAIPARSRPAATATPAGLSPAGRSGTFFSPARCLARCSFPCIICGSTSG